VGEPAVEAAVAQVLRGLGRSTPDADRFIARRWGPPPYDERVFGHPAVADSVTRLFISRMSLCDPRGTLELVRTWHQLLIGSPPRPGLSRHLLVCGVAYRWAGEFSTSVECLRQALAAATKQVGRRSAALALATSLSWGGVNDEAVALAEEAAASVRQGYKDRLNPVVLEADQVAANCRLAAGEAGLSEWMELRDRRCHSSGLSSAETADAFRGTGACWMAAGQIEPALACVATAAAIRERCVMSPLDSARIDLLLAGMSRGIEGLRDEEERDYWAVRAREARDNAVALLASACGAQHPITLRASALV
jgi:tetratricopeptide (TPR) repeat protein